MKDIKRMSIRTREIMTMNGALHPRLNVESLYLIRYECGIELLSMEECVLAQTERLSRYIRTTEEPMLKEARRETSCQIWKRMKDARRECITTEVRGSQRRVFMAIAD